MDKMLPRNYLTQCYSLHSLATGIYWRTFAFILWKIIEIIVTFNQIYQKEDKNEERMLYVQN